MNSSGEDPIEGTGAPRGGGNLAAMLGPVRLLGRFPWSALLLNAATFLVVMWIIISITFLMARLIPGGPFTQERYIPESIRARMMERYDLDEPLWRQYLNFFGNLVRRDPETSLGFRIDFGPSFYEEGRNVTDIIAESFPRSALLGATALLIALALGLPIGIVAAMRQNRWQDYTSLFIAITGVSVPSFILASLLQYIFAYRLDGLLPASGLGTGWGAAKSLIMPSVALSSFALAFIIRLVRSEMIDVLGREFIQAARARGVRMSKIVRKHALRNALLPLVTYLGPLIAALFTGSFVIESIFDIPGLGRQFVLSIENRDYGLILGVTIFYSALLVGLNMAIDVVYRFIDPRVNVAGGVDNES